MNNFVTVTINGEEVKNIAQGLPMIDALDETLDSSTLIIAPTYRKDRYMIFSQVTIKVNTITKYYYVIEDDVDVVSKQPLIYSHTVQLIEPTKLLERIHCDNLAFTQPRNSYTFPNSADIADTVTMYDVINRIRVCAMLRRETDSREYPFSIPNTLASYLKTIPAPQFFLNDGNVKDVLNQAFKYLNAISRLTNFTDLSVDFFNEYQNLLPLEDIYNYGETQNVENHCTSLMSDMRNVTSNDAAQSTVIYPSVDGWASVRSESGGIITTSNICFPTESQIYKVKKLWVWAQYKIDNETINTDQFEISQFLVEKSVYDTLPTYTTWRVITENNRHYYEVDTLGKDTAIIYDYLGNKIYGLLEVYRSIWQFPYPVLETILSYEAYKKYTGGGIPTGNPRGYATLSGNFADIMYRIEYVTVSDILGEVKRIDVSDYKVTSILKINQANNLIDVTAYGNNMAGLVQRLGNADRILTKIIKRYEDCPNVGDYTEDGYVLTTLQKAIYNDYIVVNLGLTKNFNRRSQFIDINAEIRQFLIPGKDQTLTRHSNYGEYLNIGFTEQGFSETSIFTRQGEHLLFEALANVNENKDFVPNIAILNLDNVYTYVRQVDSKALGNSICYTFGFDDNRSAGITSDKSLITEGRQIEKSTPFTNNGAFKIVNVQLDNIYNNSANNNYEQASTYARQLPNLGNVPHGITLVNTNNNGFLVCKDPAEIWRMSYQLHFVPLLDYGVRLIIGKGLLEETGIIDYEEHRRQVSVFIIDDRFSQNEIRNIRGELLYTFTPNDIVNPWNSANPPTEPEYLKLPTLPIGKSWCIGDNISKSMYLAYNPKQGEEQPTKLYLSPHTQRI